MGWPMPHTDRGTQQQLFPTLAPDGQRLYDLLHKNQQLSIDELVTLSGMTMPHVASILFDLEMQKVVRALPGRLYQPVE